MPAPITKSPTFLEVLQTAVDASVPNGRNLVVVRVLQQLGWVIHPERVLTKEGMTYTYRAVPLLGDLVLGADGKLSVPAIKVKEEPVVVANPAEPPMPPISWATSFVMLRQGADAAQLRAALRLAAPVLLAAPP